VSVRFRMGKVATFFFFFFFEAGKVATCRWLGEKSSSGVSFEAFRLV
jgi:hypothetical protein